MKSFGHYLQEGRIVGVSKDTGDTTLLHGTTDINARAILRDGFRPGAPRHVAESIEREYQLPTGSILNHVAFQFAKGRTDLDRIFFTTDMSVAQQYGTPEVVQDALTAAYSLLHLKGVETLTKEHHLQRRTWIQREASRLCRPAVLSVTLPWSVVGRYAFGKDISLEQFRQLEAKFGDMTSSLNNTSIPITALRNAVIRRVA